MRSNAHCISGNNALILGLLIAMIAAIPVNAAWFEVAISVSPATVTLYGGQTQQFTATVTGTSNTAVAWAATAGSIDASGLYTAPALISTQQTVTVTATSAADTTKSAIATVTLMPPPVAVQINPSAPGVYQGQTEQFSAWVSNTPNKAVTWTVSPAGVGTISASGLYTAPVAVAARQDVSVIATSVVDATKRATVVLSVYPMAVSAMPLRANLYAGQTQQFSSLVLGAVNTGVTWSTEPAADGVIDSVGLPQADRNRPHASERHRRSDELSSAD